MRFSGLYLALFPSRLTRLPTQLFSACALTAALTACGGGSDSSPDRTPSSFSFATQSNAELGAQATSPAVTITSISNNTPISITGGEYSINGGAFTSAAGTINNNQTVRVRTTAGDAFGDVSTVSLTIGETTASFNATTLDQDITPDALTFAAISDAALSTQVASAAQTIAGINDAAPISIDNGEYKINDGDFIATAGTVSAGDTVTVRLTTSADFNAASVATLTVGDATAPFSVTTLLQDITPNALAFTAITNADLAAPVASNAVTVEGINDVAPISIENGQYSIDGGDFTAEAGTIEAGSSVVVQLLTSTDFNTASTATLTVGELASAFSATTALQDTTPDAISFAPATDAEFGATVSSAMQTISGINSPAPISIAGGQYKINDNAFTSEAGTVNAGDVVVVSVVAGDTIDIETAATITVGGEAGTFSVTTIGDTTPPVAEVFFPTPTTFTEGESVTVRGAATDDFSAITQITLSVSAGETAGEVITIEAEEGESLDTWMQSVPLILGQANTISIKAMDAAGNEQVDAVKLSITQGNERVTFPESNIDFETNNEFRSVVYDAENNRLLQIAGLRSSDSLIATDLSSGQREVLFEFTSFNGDTSTLLLDNNFMYVVNEPRSFSDPASLYKLNLSNGEINLLLGGLKSGSDNLQFINDSTLISSSSRFAETINIETKTVSDINTPLPILTKGVYSDINKEFIYTLGFIDPGEIYVADLIEEEDGTFTLGPVKGQTTTLESLLPGFSVFSFLNISGFDLSLNTTQDTVYIADDIDESLVRVNLETFEANLLSTPLLPVDGVNIMRNPKTLNHIGNDIGIIYVDGWDADGGGDDLPFEGQTHFVVDLTTGERVVLSRFEPIAPSNP